MIPLEKWKILTPLQKLPKNSGDLGKIIVATGFEKFPKCNKSPNLVTLLERQKKTKSMQNKVCKDKKEKIRKVMLLLLDILKLSNWIK